MLRITIIFFLNIFSFISISQSWFSIYNNQSLIFTDFGFANDNTGYVLQHLNANLIKTTNGGSTWFVLPIYNINAEYSKICVINPDTIYIFGALLSSNNTTLFKSIDGGLNWNPLIHPGTVGPPPTAWFFNSNTGYYTTWGKIVKTTDAGSNWTINNIGGSNEDLFFINPTTGYFISNSYYLYKTTNASETWNLIHSFVVSLHSIYFLNDLTGYVSGNLYSDTTFRIMKTIDGGSVWETTIFSNTTGSGPSIQFLNNNIGYVCSGYRVLTTTNSGNNWVQNYNSGTYLNAMNFTSYSTGYMLGYFGRVLKTTTGILSLGNCTENIINNYLLLQNHPNPFNPNTNIKFSIPTIENNRDHPLKIIIYDILGNEIATLFNEQLRSGTYEVTFDATNYPSGTYFYRLQAGDYRETKKMVLLK